MFIGNIHMNLSEGSRRLSREPWQSTKKCTTTRGPTGSRRCCAPWRSASASWTGPVNCSAGCRSRSTYDTPEVAESRRIVDEAQRTDAFNPDEPEDDEPWRHRPSE
jgi:hypothetical protein